MDTQEKELKEDDCSGDTPDIGQLDAVSLARRQALMRIAKKAAYAAPVTLALLSMEAKACSLTC